jgi:Adenylate and Guanylate cyclase catalytic domain
MSKGRQDGCRPRMLQVTFSRWSRRAGRAAALAERTSLPDVCDPISSCTVARLPEWQWQAYRTRDPITSKRPRTWPSGYVTAPPSSLAEWRPISVGIGIACGPVIAGVIGDRKFAYDVWGDTVNAASRLESAATPGSIQVSEAVHDRLIGNYVLSEPYLVELKGKGATTAHRLLGRSPMEESAGRRTTGSQHPTSVS